MEFDRSKMEWIEYDLLTNYSHIVHGTFLRHGGVSKGKYGSLNLGNTTSDHVENYKKNRELVQETLEVPLLIFPHLLHGNNVLRVTAKNMQNTFQSDALFTTEKNVALGVTHADCQAACFYDPVHEAVGVVHAGWKGLAQNIYQRMIDSMQREIGSQPQNLIVCISPSLGPDHAEFKNYKQELPQEFWQFQTEPNFFDLWAISRMQLNAGGVLDKNIEISEVCTYCNEEDCFSYRREKDTGRHGTIIALKG